MAPFATLIISFITSSVLGFDDECNGVYRKNSLSTTNAKQLYPIDVCEGERISGEVESEIYECETDENGEVGVLLTIYSSLDCTGNTKFPQFLAYPPDNDEVDINCELNSAEDCTYAIVRTYLNDDTCAKGNVSRASTDYFDSTEPVNRCRYNEFTDVSTKTQCNATTVWETHYSGAGCITIQTGDDAIEVIFENGCDNDWDHLSTELGERLAYTEIHYCPTSNSNIISTFIGLIIGTIVIMIF